MLRPTLIGVGAIGASLLIPMQGVMPVAAGKYVSRLANVLQIIYKLHCPVFPSILEKYHQLFPPIT